MVPCRSGYIYLSQNAFIAKLSRTKVKPRLQANRQRNKGEEDSAQSRNNHESRGQMHLKRESPEDHSRRKGHLLRTKTTISFISMQRTYQWSLFMFSSLFEYPLICPSLSGIAKYIELIVAKREEFELWLSLCSKMIIYEIQCAQLMTFTIKRQKVKPFQQLRKQRWGCKQLDMSSLHCYATAKAKKVACLSSSQCVCVIFTQSRKNGP